MVSVAIKLTLSATKGFVFGHFRPSSNSGSRGSEQINGVRRYTTVGYSTSAANNVSSDIIGGTAKDDGHNEPVPSFVLRRMPSKCYRDRFIYIRKLYVAQYCVESRTVLNSFYDFHEKKCFEVKARLLRSLISGSR